MKRVFAVVFSIFVVFSICFATENIRYEVELITPENITSDGMIYFKTTPNLSNNYHISCSVEYDKGKYFALGDCTDGFTLKYLVEMSESYYHNVCGKDISFDVNIIDNNSHMVYMSETFNYHVPAECKNFITQEENKNETNISESKTNEIVPIISEKDGSVTIVEKTNETIPIIVARETQTEEYNPNIINAFWGKNVLISMDGKYVEFYNANGGRVYPLIIDGTTYLPIRALSNLFSVPIYWEESTQSIYLGRGEQSTNSVRFKENVEKEFPGYTNAEINRNIKVFYNNQLQSFADANGNKVYPVSFQYTTYLPVRAMSNLFEAQIDWDDLNREVKISKKNVIIEEPIKEETEDISNVNFNGELDISEILSGVFVNKKGETLKVYEESDFYYSIIYTEPENIGEEFKDFIGPEFYRAFVGYPKYDVNTSTTSYPLIVRRETNSKEFDTYIISLDKKKLISQKRGEEFDFVKISDEYTREDYKKDKLVQNSKITGEYIDDTNRKYILFEITDYALGKRECIEEGWHCYPLIDPYNDFLLGQYINDNSISNINKAYSYEWGYANHRNYIVVLENGNVLIINCDLEGVADKISVSGTTRKLTKINNQEFDSLPDGEGH